MNGEVEMVVYSDGLGRRLEEITAVITECDNSVSWLSRGGAIPDKEIKDPVQKRERKN